MVDALLELYLHQGQPEYSTTEITDTTLFIKGPELNVGDRVL
jgi:hypothetical protein